MKPTQEKQDKITIAQETCECRLVDKLVSWRTRGRENNRQEKNTTCMMYADKHAHATHIS